VVPHVETTDAKARTLRWREVSYRAADSATAACRPAIVHGDFRLGTY